MSTTRSGMLSGAIITLTGEALAFALYLYGTSIVGPVRGGVYHKIGEKAPILCR